MLIRDWMTKDVVTVTPETTMMKASKILKDNNFRRLPVVDDKGVLLGIVSDRDIKEASPSKATTLDIHEVYYLLSEIKVKDIMTKVVASLKPTDTVERAALIMTEKTIGGMPVVDDDNKVVGIVTDSDLFKVLISITGVKHGGVQMGFEVSDEPGSLRAIVEELRRLGARVVSVLTNFESPGDNTRQVYIRLRPMSRGEENSIIEQIQGKFNMLYWARDNVHTTT